MYLENRMIKITLYDLKMRQSVLQNYLSSSTILKMYDISVVESLCTSGDLK